MTARCKKSYGDNKLARWVRLQRIGKTIATLEPAREQRLNELGFAWDPRDQWWEDMFGRLVFYKQQHGDCRVPVSYRDKQLVRWVSNQRTAQNASTLDPTREQRLNELGFVWDPIGRYWEDMFGRLIVYKQQYGDCRVPVSYRDKQLVSWVSNQRTAQNTSKLDPTRVRRLEELGFVWDARDGIWYELFARLVAYKEQHGDCLVPQSYSDKQLAIWVNTQRRLKNKGKLEAAREQRLNELEFVWNARK